MKNIEVVAAIVFSEGRIFATQRGYGEFSGLWEFPGGKIEFGETPQQALVREISEELDIEIEVGTLIETVEYDYPAFHLSMHCFKCGLVPGQVPYLREHSAAKWLSLSELETVEWLPADIEVVRKLKNIGC